MTPFSGQRFGLGAVVAVAFSLYAAAALADEVYQTPEAFVAQAFGGEPPPPKRLWITKPRKADERTVEATWRRIGTLLDHFSPQECANYIANAGYASN